MYIDEFYKEISTDLENFKSYWMQQHKLEPEKFPLEMNDDNSGEWMLQFLAYINFNL